VWNAASAEFVEEHELVAVHGLPNMVEVLESHLLALRPEPDSIVDEVRALVDAAESDHGMHRAEELAAQASMSLRSLRRLFTEYVGIGPKWVVSRNRDTTRDVPADRLARLGCGAAGARQRGWTSSAVPLPATRVSSRVAS